MQNNKLLSIITRFDKVLLNRLRKFIASPFFNANNNILLLFDWYVEGIKKKKKETYFDLKIFWKLNFPDSSYQDAKLRKLKSDLLKIVEKFLIQLELEKDSTQQSIYLAQSTAGGNFNRLNNTAKSNLKREIEKSPYRNADFYLKKYYANRAIYLLDDMELVRKSDASILDLNEDLDIFFLTEKLKLVFESLTRKSIIDKEIEVTFSEELIQWINHSDYKNIPSIAIPFHVIQAYKNDDDNHYKELVKMLEAHIHEFPKKEAESFYTYAINYCIRQVNKNKAEFNEQFLTINEQMLKSNLIEKGEWSPWKYKNIVTIGLRDEKFEWVEYFIHQYLEYLPPKYQDNALNFNLANLYYYTQQYDKVIEYLHKVKYNEVTYELNARTLFIVTYYELDEYDAMIYQCDSFTSYLKRHKELAKDKTQRFLNFVRYSKKIINNRFADQSVIDKLRLDIEKHQIINKNWLLTKLNEL